MNKQEVINQLKNGEELTSNYNQYDDDCGREGDDFRRT